MESFKVENLSFTYPDRYDKALSDINLTINQGEFILLCGKSGSGKTTLLKLLKPALSPFGNMDGQICFNGIELSSYDTREQASEIGFVMQNPDNQIVTDKVWHELSFGLESLGYKTSEIRARVSEMASFFGIENWFYKNVSELSGGQKQILNLASIMAMSPSVLILDEPTSQLDPIATGEFLRTLEKINRELGTTIILSEHRLEEAFPIADRVVVMDCGKIIADAPPRAVGGILKDLDHDMSKALPTQIRVHSEVPNTLPCPLTVRDGRIWLSEFAMGNKLNPDAILKETKENQNAETVIEVKDAWFRYEKNAPDVIKDLNLEIKKGERFVLLGGNGTGKTTALSLISGLNKPYRGDVLINGENVSKINNLYDGLLAVLPQNPQSVFVKNTVYLDLLEILEDKKLSKDDREERVKEVAKLCRIENLLEYHPYDLSGGEQQRTALAKVLLKEPEILLLDEPTKGMDAKFKEEFAGILDSLKKCGVTVLMVSHDIEFSAEYADRCALMFDGNITSIDTPREFFKGKSFYTTSANRMARAFIPDAILAKDIILACGGKIEENKNNKQEDNFNKTVVQQKSDFKEAKKEIKKTKKLNKSTWISILSIILLIPITLYAGTKFLGNRKYYFISLLIIIETIIPFFLAFESKKPRAREIVVISVLCGLAVAGRAVFASVPQVKPVVAIIILSGVCLGGETGFLVGAVTGFISNFFFGQGPWTPWQMFTLGIIGFIAGILFKADTSPKKRILLCLFGFFVTVVIYGGIMNPASVIMWQDNITWEMVLSTYAVGLPFDLIHALGTAFFLWILSKPMIEKILRIKVKYGLMSR